MPTFILRVVCYGLIKISLPIWLQPKQRERFVAHLPHLAALKHLNMKQGLPVVLSPEKETIEIDENVSFYKTNM